MRKLALEGIRVIELGQAAAVPLLTQQLAAFGAEVVKVESKKKPDIMREGKGPGIDVLGGPIFQSLHWNKKNVTVNLGTRRGIEIVKSLVSISDVVAENYTPGVMRNWGLDYENLRAVKPDIIMIGLPGFGSCGPRSGFLSVGPTITSVVGMNYLWGPPGRPRPTGSPTNYSDFLSSGQGAFAVVSALLHRAKTGKGSYIEAAQVEVMASTMGHIYLDHELNDRNQRPSGNRSSYAAPHGCYRCKGEDKWCAIAVFSDEEWSSFCNAIGNPAWTEEARFSTNLARIQNADELDRLIEQWTVNYSPHEVMEILQKAGVAAGVVQNGQDLHDCPHLRERQFMVNVSRPGCKKVSYEGIPAKLSNVPNIKTSPSPVLGEHTQYVCRDLLGLSASDIEGLVEEEVLV